MVLIVAASQSESIVEQLEEVGEEACVIGSVVPCDACRYRFVQSFSRSLCITLKLITASDIVFQKILGQF